MVHPDDDWEPVIAGDRPTCCDRPMLPIVCGMPDVELMEASARGEVSLGGCCIEDGLPEFECGVCGRMEGSSGSELSGKTH